MAPMVLDIARDLDVVETIKKHPASIFKANRIRKPVTEFLACMEKFFSLSEKVHLAVGKDVSVLVR